MQLCLKFLAAKIFLHPVSCIFLCCKANTFCSSCWWGHGWWVGYFLLLHMHRGLAMGWRAAACSLPSLGQSFFLEKQKEITFSAASFLPSFPLPAAEEREDSRARTRFVSWSVPAEVTAQAWCWPIASLHHAGGKPSYPSVSPILRGCIIHVALQPTPALFPFP